MMNYGGCFIVCKVLVASVVESGIDSQFSFGGILATALNYASTGSIRQAGYFQRTRDLSTTPHLP